MYRRLIITIIGFLLVFSPVAIAQQDNPSANAPKSMTGEIDVGYRATDAAGDAAQYERYRDLRDGVHSNIEFTLDPGKYFFSFNGTNAGYRDQYFDGTFKNKKIELFGFHNSTPLNYAYNTLTPVGGIWRGLFLTQPGCANGRSEQGSGCPWNSNHICSSSAEIDISGLVAGVQAAAASK